jgi:hypothetical protein
MIKLLLNTDKEISDLTLSNNFSPGGVLVLGLLKEYLVYHVRIILLSFLAPSNKKMLIKKIKKNRNGEGAEKFTTPMKPSMFLLLLLLHSSFSNISDLHSKELKCIISCKLHIIFLSNLII